MSPRILPLILFLAAAASAQVPTSRIEGTVVDPSGAFVLDARVKCVSDETGYERKVATVEEGFFVFPSLPPGLYRVIVEAAGFRSEEITGIELRVATTTTVQARLELGSTAESVTVAAPRINVQVSDAHGGGVIEQRDIDILPQVERNPVRLALFQPGVQVSAGSLGISRVNGTRQGSNVLKLDGVDMMEPVAPGLGFAAVPTSDSIQEFRVITHAGKAEYGRAGGAQIEMMTRSGTNRWNATLYHFHRNTALNANEFFNNATGIGRPKFVYNNFGGALGGPVRRGQTFAFFSYSGLQTRQDVSRNRLVLTPEARMGLFRWRSSGVLQSFDIVGSDRRSIGIDSTVAASLRLLPEPNNFDHPMSDGLNTGGFRFNNPAANQNNIVTGRLDHALGQNHRVFFRYLTYAGARATDAVNGADATFPGQPHGLVIPGVRGFSSGSTTVLSPRAINDLRVGRNEVSFENTRPSRIDGPMIVSSVWTSPLNPQFAREQRGIVTSAADTLSVHRGCHILKTGLEWRTLGLRLRDATGIYPNVFLGLDGGNSIPTGVGPQPGTISSADLQRFGEIYNHLLGRISRVDQSFYSNLTQFLVPGTARERHFRNHEVHAFFQDDWRVRPNVTLNLGVRYEMHGPPSERDRLQGTFDKAHQISNSSQISDLTVVRRNSWYKRDWNNFAPRAALVWDPKGNGKTAVRLNYGIYYDAMIGNVTLFTDQRTPGFVQALSVFPNQQPGSDHRLSDRIPTQVQPSALLLRLPNQRNGTAAVINPNLRTGYLQQYGVGIQRELAPSFVIDAAWVANRGIKLFMQTMPNQLRIGEDFLQAFGELQMFRASGALPSANNTLVRLYGSPQAAVAGVGAQNLDQGAAGQAADLVDRTSYTRYAAAGLSDFYLRNFPQYNMLFFGTNDGRTYYDSLQVSVRHKAGTAHFEAHYTWGKTIDLLANAGAGQESVIDHFNLRLNRALSDFDRPHVISGFAVWTLPFGRGRHLGSHWPAWARAVAGGWDIGGIGIWESGAPFTVRSGRQTAGAPTASFADVSGGRDMGAVRRRGDGVYYFTPDEIRRFSFPGAGQIGTAGRNTFRGPGLLSIDLSLSNRVRLSERRAVSFRVEVYNLLNTPNFANPAANLLAPAAFGKIGTTVRGLTGAPIGETFGGPRVVQLMLRLDL